MVEDRGWVVGGLDIVAENDNDCPIAVVPLM